MKNLKDLQHSRPLMDPQKLQHFLLVYDLGNFARAAEVASITQQAVSKSIARLEESLEVKLFERGAYGAEPTAFGHSLAKRAKIIITETRLAKAELNALKGATDGFVKVGFGWSFMPRIAPLVINRFRERRPGVTLSIVTGSSRRLFRKLQKGEVEFVASAPPADYLLEEGLETKLLFKEKDAIVMRAQHPLARKPSVSLKDLSEQTWLVSLALHEQWRLIADTFIKAGAPPPENIIDIDSVFLTKSILLQSDAVCLLAQELVQQDVERGELKTFELSEFPRMRTAYCTLRRGALLQPAASALMADVSNVCGAIYDKSLRAHTP